MIHVFLLWVIFGLIVLIEFLIAQPGFENNSGFNRLTGIEYINGGMRCKRKTYSASIMDAMLADSFDCSYCKSIGLFNINFCSILLNK